MSGLRAVLVRHGETPWNAERRWQGHQGVSLSALGRAQARAVAEYLAACFEDVALVVRSDLDRVVETAGPIVELLDAEVRVDPRWREIDVGTWSGRTREEIAVADPEGFAAWCRGEDPRRGGGEREADLRGRIRAALDDLAALEGTVVVVTHGGPIRQAAAEALGLDVAGAMRLAGAANGSVTELERGEAGWALRRYNTAEHVGAGETRASAAPSGRGAR